MAAARTRRGRRTLRQGIELTLEACKPGSWQPGRFAPLDSHIVTAALIVTAMICGIDYLLPSPVSTSSLAIVEAAFPLYTWGLMFILPSLTLWASVLLRIHIGVWASHWAAAIVFSGLAVGLGMEYGTRPFFDGIRSATMLILPVTVHALLAIRMKPRPAAQDRRGIDE